MKGMLKSLLKVDANEFNRNKWLTETLESFPFGLRILDAGAGELRNKPLCSHLQYVSQDICQYEGTGNEKGLQTGTWNTSQIDVVCDITAIPEADQSFDIILCSEVFEHLPDPLKAIEEFQRLLKPGGKLVVTAPFASLVHFAPYFYATGFSRYWYEYHFPLRGLRLDYLQPNGDWFDFTQQEILRLPKMARLSGNAFWPLAYLAAGAMLLYFTLRRKGKPSDDVASFGWHSIATKVCPS
jgi:SAM-dependent methyltransferase